MYVKHQMKSTVKFKVTLLKVIKEPDKCIN